MSESAIVQHGKESAVCRGDVKTCEGGTVNDSPPRSNQLCTAIVPFGYFSHPIMHEWLLNHAWSIQCLVPLSFWFTQSQELGIPMFGFHNKQGNIMEEYFVHDNNNVTKTEYALGDSMIHRYGSPPVKPTHNMHVVPPDHPIVISFADLDQCVRTTRMSRMTKA
jgi:hypothetical protein